MPRIPYPDPATLSRETNEAVEKAGINVVRMMAGASPAVFDGFNKFAGAFYGHASISANLREVGILRVGYLSNAPYETYHHEALGRQVGLSDQQIAAIKQGGRHPGILDPTQQAVLTFTEELVTNVRPSDAALAEIRSHLSDQQMIDLVLVVGAYMVVCRFLETTGVEIDGQPLDWENRPDLMGDTP